MIRPFHQRKLECIDIFDDAVEALEGSQVSLPNLDSFFDTMILLGWVYVAMACFCPCLTCYKVVKGQYGGLSFSLLLVILFNAVFNITLLYYSVGIR